MIVTSRWNGKGSCIVLFQGLEGIPATEGVDEGAFRFPGIISLRKTDEFLDLRQNRAKGNIILSSDMRTC